MKTVRPVLFALTVLLLLTGCFSTPRLQQQAAVQKRAFAPVADTAAAQTTRFPAIKIRTFRTLPPFDARTFIVRRAGGEFVFDYYNTWIAPPNDLIRVQTARYLEESHLFAAVYDASSGTLPPLGLEGIISECYLDFSSSKPAAVVTLRLLVLDERTTTLNVLFSDEKSARVEFDASSKTAPAVAFGAALTQTLNAQVQALSAAPLPSK